MHDSYIRGGCIQSSDEKPANANWVWIALIFTAQRSRPLVYYCHSLVWPTECICTRFVFLRKCMSLSVCARSVIRMQWRSIRVIHDDVWRALASCTHTHKRKTESRSRVPLPAHARALFPAECGPLRHLAVSGTDSFRKTGRIQIARADSGIANTDERGFESSRALIILQIGLKRHHQNCTLFNSSL